MAKIIVNSGEYNNDDAIENVINYDINSSYTNQNLVGSNNVLDIDVESMVDTMKMTQICFNKTTGRQIHHIELGFKEESISSYEAYSYTKKISEFIGQTHQNVFAIHKRTYNKKNYVHAHIAINPIGFRDGAVFEGKRKNYAEIADILKDLLDEEVTVIFKGNKDNII
ncbi:relaxase/mobilization nuclease domain-containing protein [Sedimentibacter sp. zth1]|uniref:relaxase/mobilization nuclease domain-containing protein n=1 Tax=Sedimentibacter sp. zth1 TaxID=2816908 RepID=UPI001A929E8B|nr:relaxase/mobilization nuclease domain-containing protein [Sedimentibacter sp. zth1]QSX04804.1 relaxase/mobilization nuclease domain-containing protein [Sedimentibacter sp. zth1]